MLGGAASTHMLAHAWTDHPHESPNSNEQESKASKESPSSRDEIHHGRSTASFEATRCWAKRDTRRVVRVDRSKSVAAMSMQARAQEHGFCGHRPLVTPQEIPLDLLFFRRVFSNLLRRCGNEQDEVPVSVFQRSVVRLFHIMGMSAEFDASAYDIDRSGAVGWAEFVTCWRRSKLCATLSTPERCFFALEDAEICVIGRAIGAFIMALISFSCVSFVVGTLPTLQYRAPDCPRCEPQQPASIDIIETICVIFFTMEYLTRVLLAPFCRDELLDYERVLDLVTEHEEMSIPKPAVRFLKFVTAPMNIIDLSVIAPFYLELIIGTVSSNFTVFRVLRLTRLCRLVRLGRYFEIFKLTARVFYKSFQVLNVLLVYLVLAVCFAGSAMYFVEGGKWDPEIRDYVRTDMDGESSVTPFKSIPHAFWWCIVTFTTVGYGDDYPVTVLGKVVATCTMLTGLIIIALPISVITSVFNEMWSKRLEERRLEAEAQEQDLLSVAHALQNLECRTRFVVEIFDGHDDGEIEFLGEVECIDLPLDSAAQVAKEMVLPLQPNLSKSALERARGTIAIGYTWTPKSREAEVEAGSVSDTEGGAHGCLRVCVHRAEGLAMCDWKSAGFRDTFAVVHCWPRPEEYDGARRRTVSAKATLNPTWEESFSFHYDWPKNWQPISLLCKNFHRTRSLDHRRPLWPTSMNCFSAPGSALPAVDNVSCTDDILEAVNAQDQEIQLLKGQVFELLDIIRKLTAGTSALNGEGHEATGNCCGP